MKWKKAFLASIMCGALCFGYNTAAAAYQLSEEVTMPTHALKMASQIGVLKHETPALKNLADKDAIVVMSFGTTFKDTRKKTIDATVEAIKKKHPGVKVVTSYASHIVIKRVKEKEGLVIPTPEEALEQLKKEGYTRVALVSLDVIPGIEYNYKMGVFHGYKDQFKKMTFGTPLMYWQGQEGQADDVAEAVKGLLGLSIMDSAIKHLGDRAKKSTVIGKLYGSMDLDGDSKAQEHLFVSVQNSVERRC